MEIRKKSVKKWIYECINRNIKDRWTRRLWNIWYWNQCWKWKNTESNRVQNKIKDIREKECISQSELAELSNLLCGYIWHLEKGSRKNPSYIYTNKLLEVLKVSTKDLEER